MRYSLRNAADRTGALHSWADAVANRAAIIRANDDDPTSKHDPWPTANFLLYTSTQAYKEFENRLGQIKIPRGEKTALVEAAIARQSEDFTVSDIQRACPGVSVDLIRTVLKRLKGAEIECLGRGPAAKWRKKRRKG